MKRIIIDRTDDNLINSDFLNYLLKIKILYFLYDCKLLNYDELERTIMQMKKSQISI